MEKKFPSFNSQEDKKTNLLNFTQPSPVPEYLVVSLIKEFNFLNLKNAEKIYNRWQLHSLPLWRLAFVLVIWAAVEWAYEI